MNNLKAVQVVRLLVFDVGAEEVIPDISQAYKVFTPPPVLRIRKGIELNVLIRMIHG